MDRVTRIMFWNIIVVLVLNICVQVGIWYECTQLENKIKLLKQQQRVQEILIQKNAENTWRVWYDHYQ